MSNKQKPQFHPDYLKAMQEGKEKAYLASGRPIHLPDNSKAVNALVEAMRDAASRSV